MYTVCTHYNIINIREYRLHAYDKMLSTYIIIGFLHRFDYTFKYKLETKINVVR